MPSEGNYRGRSVCNWLVSVIFCATHAASKLRDWYYSWCIYLFGASYIEVVPLASKLQRIQKV